jgi:carboxylesterase 2
MTDDVYANTVFAPLVSTLLYEPPPFRPVLDGYVLPARYIIQLREGNHSLVPILTGSNRDEDGAVPSPGFSVLNYTSVNSKIFRSVNLSAEFAELYPAGDSALSADEASNAFYNDQRRVGKHLWANAYSAGCAKNSSTNNPCGVFVYTWTHAPPGQSRGAYHSNEILYAFNNLYGTDLPWTDETSVSPRGCPTIGSTSSVREIQTTLDFRSGQ